VWRDATANVFVRPPCGDCRLFVIDAHLDNLADTSVTLSHDEVVLCVFSMPYHDWWLQQPVW
jgi:hypothetical protein